MCAYQDPIWRQCMKKFGKIMVIVLALATLIGACFAFTACNNESNDVAKVINYKLTDEQYAFCVNKGDTELLAQVNSFMAEIKENGTFEEILNKYFGDGTPTPVTSAAAGTENALIVATNAAFEPFEYTEGANFLGVDMEIAKLLADHLGRPLVINNMDFDSVVTSVEQGTCDIGMAGLTITPSRQEQVTFADPYYDASQVVVARADDTTFDGCKSAEDVAAILESFGANIQIGYQNGTTGGFYINGDADWGFDGLTATGKAYRNGSLAIQDMINGNIDYVIIDEAPANRIVDSMNALA